MSKGNMFLGLARGSVGDITFYRRNAQQITRVRVRNIKNPQSPAQMYQRAINRTAVQAYSLLKSICDHSFEGISYGANSYSRFLSLNMDMLRHELATEASTAFKNRAFLPKNISGCVAMPFILSTGSIAPIQVAGGNQGGTFVQETIEVGGGVNFEISLLRIALHHFAEESTITYKDFAEMIGAQQGDQLTIVRLRSALSAGFADEPVASSLVLARVILDPAHGQWDETAMFSLEDAVGGYQGLRVNDPNLRNEGDAFFASKTTSGEEKILVATAGMTDFEATEDVGLAAIISRQKADGSWLRSRAVLAYSPGFRENGYTIKQASTLEVEDVPIESDFYLNNAE